MADPTIQQVLEQLAAQGAQLRAVQAELARHRRRRRPRRLLPLLAVALLVALAPLAVLAVTPFTDLTGGVHDANIDAIYAAGVTKGCVPNEQYCPTANVTREEMASFLARLGGLGSNPPVANAKTAQTATSAQNANQATTADTATNAGNASTVGGFAPNGLARVARSAPSTSYIPLTRENVPVFSVTLTPPGPGFVLVTATVLVSMSPPTANRVNYGEIRLQDTGGSGAAAYSPATFVPLGMYPFNTREQATTVSWVFPVSGPAPRTFLALARQQFAPDGANYETLVFVGDSGYGGSAIALFIPFDGTGAPPTP